MTPVASTDGAGGVSKKFWYVALVSLRAEKSVRDNLQRYGIQAFVASRKEIHIWRREERRVIEKVLIPAVVFVHTTNAERETVLKQPNVKAFMVNPAARKTAYGRNPLAVIPDAEMQLLQDMLAQNDIDVTFATSNFAIGDRVKILGLGTTEHFAQIIRIPGDSNTFVGVRLETLGCAYMHIPQDRIVKVNPEA